MFFNTEPELLSSCNCNVSYLVLVVVSAVSMCMLEVELVRRAPRRQRHRLGDSVSVVDLPQPSSHAS